ncbi:hypothetical protein HD599_002032 [Conyzicola lurida]|uniref:Uncharacterized protein n=1 Tax=Conyzicola lurida TaxID=1172621 RepID=A0A841AQL0_9MICO|nr:hypothetical protein [Conyzicola lurida]MBB5843709.1 hypothetical protein [Conyzicola lurida]
MTQLRFDGSIAGFGTASGTRIVVGIWADSPLGRFADVMIEDAAGTRLLIAPSDSVAEFVSTTYVFDEVVVAPVTVTRVAERISVAAGPLAASFVVGGVSPLGRLLRLVPRSIATRPGWLRLIDPVASLIVPGARTAGSAGTGRREFYGVTSARRISSIEAQLRGVDLGVLAPLTPPVRFGFGSAPADPSLVRVVTTIVDTPAG